MTYVIIIYPTYIQPVNGGCKPIPPCREFVHGLHGKNLACQPNSRHDNFVLLSLKKKLVLVVAQVATRGCSGRRPPGGKNQ